MENKINAKTDVPSYKLEMLLLGRVYYRLAEYLEDNLEL